MFMRNLVPNTLKTAEIVASKLIPAGMGWQAAAILSGLDPSTALMWLSTGAGEAAFVFAGHLSYMSVKKQIVPSAEINLAQETKTAAWLATAALGSGTTWQPLLNTMADQGASFPLAATVTGVGCASVFFALLRMGRPIYDLKQPHSLSADARLSFAISGAAALFVATDPSLANNFLAGIYGVYDHTPDLTAVLTAGAATGSGFFAAALMRDILLLANVKTPETTPVEIEDVTEEEKERPTPR